MNDSKYIPLYLTYPIAINGTDTAMQSQDVASFPKRSNEMKYVSTDTATKKKKKKNCLADSPKT